VSYLLKALGYQVTANDFLTFPAVIARATVANQHATLGPGDIERICGPAADDRDFISAPSAAGSLPAPTWPSSTPPGLTSTG